MVRRNLVLVSHSFVLPLDRGRSGIEYYSGLSS